MQWTFVIKTGQMLDPSGKLVAVGYAGGNLGKNPEGRNNAEMVSVHNIGPLPMGWYTFGQLFNPHPRLGQYAFELIPDPANEMFGRGGFFCHGDTVPAGNASEGCIIMPRLIREQMYEGQIRRLQVIAS
jgi:hypothetical protein